MVKDLTKSYLEEGIDALGEANPAFKALSPLLKGMLDAVFNMEETDPMEEIKAKLDEIDQKEEARGDQSRSESIKPNRTGDEGRQ